MHLLGHKTNNESCRNDINIFKKASLEHIMPDSWGGPDDDANFIIASVHSNSERGDLGLLEFLDGKNSYPVKKYNHHKHHEKMEALKPNNV
ncbi:MAG: hypothetical protein MZV70_76930 [Desulfobacterales bacterium]|nr:hypothetical protein [Desulfobacterales bacterium]